MTAVFIILLILILLLAAIGLILAAYSMRIRPQTLEQARRWQAEHYDLSWYDRLEKTDYTVRSFDGYILHAQLLRNPRPSGRYIILSHGYTDNRIGSLKYAKMYLDLGFQVIVYDLRGHGENEKTFCTYSVRERKDLCALITDSRARFPDLETLGLHGESLGSASTLAALRYAPPVDFAVADCGFAEIASVLKDGLRRMHLPGCLVSLASLGARLLYGVSYRDMRPVDCLKGNRVPVLFIHGEEDDFIPPAHSLALRQADPGYSELCLIPGASHAVSVLTSPEEYRGAVTAFLRNIAVLPPAAS